MKQGFIAPFGNNPPFSPACHALLYAAALGAPLAFAQQAEQPMQGMDHSQMQGMDHGSMKGMDHGQMKDMNPDKPKDSGDMKGIDHSQMKGMDHGQMKGMSPGQPEGPGSMQGMDHGSMQNRDHGQMKGTNSDRPKDSGDMKGMSHDQPGSLGTMKGMDHGQMKGISPGQPKASGPTQGMDHGQMKGPGDMQGMNHGDMKGMNQGGMEDSISMEGMDHGKMEGMGSMQGGSAPPNARDPDAYADGLTLGPMRGMDMADNDPYAQLLLDQFEGYRSSSGESGIRFDAQAWYGTDLNKAWLKAEGGRSGGKLGETRAELLYNRAFAPYFGWQAGVRHDFGGGPGRNWAAVGIQGLAPYWFAVEATAYVGPSGRTAFRFKGEYDLRITQRLVLQPDLEFDIYGKNDLERNIGSGLSEADLGLRLRYEITRKFAPYIGVSWGRKFGNTADFARRSGEPVGESRIIAGIRLWFRRKRSRTCHRRLSMSWQPRWC